MSDFNKVILAGNLTHDPDLRYTPGGAAVCNLGLAINRTYFDRTSRERREDTTFVEVTVWGRQAETAGAHLAKGRKVLIDGRLQMNEWEVGDEKRSKLKIVAEQVTFL